MNLGHEDERKELKRSTSELKEGVSSIASMLNKHGSGELSSGVSKERELSASMTIAMRRTSSSNTFIPSTAPNSCSIVTTPSSRAL